MSSTDQPWYTLLRLPTDDSPDVLCPHTAVSSVETLNSGGVLMTSDNTSNMVVEFHCSSSAKSNPLIEIEAKDESECACMHHTKAFAKEKRNSTSDLLENENMEQPISQLMNEIGNGRILVTNGSRPGLVGLPLEESNTPTATTVIYNADSEGGYRNNSNNVNELRDNKKYIHDIMKPTIPIPNILMNKMSASTSTIPSTSVPQFLQEWDLPEATIPEMAESSSRPFEWLDTREQEPTMKPVICYPHSSSAGYRQVFRTFPFQEMSSGMEEIDSQVLSFTKYGAELKAFPYQELCAENTDHLYPSPFKHNDNININNNNNNNNDDNATRGDGGRDNEKEDFFRPDISEPHTTVATQAARKCTQTDLVERISVEHLQGAKEQCKHEYTHRDLLEYANEETPHIHGGYYAQETNREPHLREQTHMGEHQYLIEHAHVSSEHVYTDHLTQGQYFHFDEQNYICPSRVTPLFIKEEKEGRGEVEGEGEAGREDGGIDGGGGAEEKTAGGSGGWLTEDCGYNYWDFSPR